MKKACRAMDDAFALEVLDMGIIEQKLSIWIADLLEVVESGSEQHCALIARCGEGCARRKGVFAAMDALREQAKGCTTKEDYATFLCKSLHLDAVIDDEGIVLRLHKTACSCPMYPAVQSPMLCECTRGHERSSWSRFFGKEIDVRIEESFLRGGNDCVVKLIMR